MKARRGDPGRVSGTVGGAVPLNLIHTNNSPNPISMRVPGRLTFFQTVHLQRLRDEFGVDISGAENLTGPLLDEWIARAEETLFHDLMGGLNAKT